jgi:hypothetical protein
MAKQKMNGGNPIGPTNKVTGQKTSVYTKEQQEDMKSRYGGDERAKAAAIKEDIQGGNMPKRYPTGSQSYKEAQTQSEANIMRKATENRMQGATRGPGNDWEREEKAKEVKQAPKMKDYSDMSAAEQEAWKKKNATEKKKGNTDIIYRPR